MLIQVMLWFSPSPHASAFVVYHWCIWCHLATKKASYLWVSKNPRTGEPALKVLGQRVSLCKTTKIKCIFQGYNCSLACFWFEQYLLTLSLIPFSYLRPRGTYSWVSPRLSPLRTACMKFKEFFSIRTYSGLSPANYVDATHIHYHR